ncbi:MAG TPA: hypothetical protein VE868_04060, partial [Balneolaceae bacterium]|nr:hypothetical protein [Balneolaceae bacterium]
MKLRTKLISSFTAIVILLLLIGIASQYFNDRIKDRVIDESQNAVKELQISGTLEAYLNQSFINTQYYLDERYHSTIVNYEDSLINAENAKRNVRIALQGLNLNLQKIDRFINKNQS